MVSNIQTACCNEAHGKMFPAVSEYIQVIVLWLNGWFADRNVLGQIITAFASAFAGAYGAQWIAEKTKSKSDLVRELRETNAALALAGAICNIHATNKSQSVRPQKVEYEKQLALVQLHAALPPEARAITGPLHMQFDLRQFQLPILPDDRLLAILFEKVSITDRALHVATTLCQEIAELRKTFERRNEVIGRFPSLTDDQKARLYFGLQDSNGHVDENYRNSVSSIYDKTDNCIFFSWLLCQDLHLHGAKISKHIGKMPWRRAPSAHRASFAVAEQNGLMPPFEQYKDWVGGYGGARRKTKLSWWKRFRKAVRRKNIYLRKTCTL
jgi:hypothetical protein